MIEELKPYLRMKDSGVSWLEEVPEHWIVTGLRRKLQTYHGVKIGPFGSQLKLDQMSASGYKVFGQGNVISNDFHRGTKFVDERKFEELSTCAIFPGDLVVTMMGTSGRCALVPEDAPSGIMDSHLLRIRTDSTFAANFAARLINEAPYVKEQILVAGKGSIMHGLNSSIVKDLKLAFPPLPEQTAIARFLDHMDLRIQKYIRAKEKLIALLDEYKQALIHQAVTGQIDVQTGEPYPQYKASGVEWLGELPAHWQTCRLRNVVSTVTTGSRGWASFASDEGPLFIRIANLSRGSLRLRFNDVVRLNLPKTAEAARTRIDQGDLLVSVTAYIGSIAVAPPELNDAYVSQHVARCKPVKGSNSWWLGYVLLSRVGQAHGQLSLYGGTKDGLSLDDVKNYPILLPPKCEQDCIVHWIEKQETTICNAICLTQSQMERIKEYRARAIADIVTGKLDVRDAAVALDEATAVT